MASLGQLDNETLIENYKLGKYNLNKEPTVKDIHPALLDYGKPKPQDPSLISDLGTSVKAGSLDTAAGLVNVGSKLGVVPQDTATETINSLTSKAEQARTTRGKEFNAKVAEQFVNDEGLNLKAFNAPKILGGLAESTPAIAGTILGAGALEAVAAPVAGAIGLGKVGVGLAEAFPSLGRLAGAIPGTASAGNKINKLIGTSLSTGTAEGVIAAGQDSNSVMKQAMETPIETYRKNPLFQETLNSIDPNLPLDQRESQAKQILAERAADEAFTDTFSSTAGIGVATGGGAIGGLKRAFQSGTGPITSNIIKSLGKGAAEEMFQETPQSAAEQYLSNKALQKFVDPSKDVNEGVLNAAVEGGVLGAVSGGALGGVSHFSSVKTDPTEAAEKAVNPLTGTEYQNKDVKAAFNNYNQTASANTDINSEAYTSAYNSSRAALEDTLKEENVDPIKVQEAIDTLDFIKKSHQALVNLNVKEEQKAGDNKVVGEALANPDSSELAPVDIVSEIVDNNPKIVKQNPEIATKVLELKDQGKTPEEIVQEVVPVIEEQVAASEEFDTVSDEVEATQEIPVEESTSAERRSNAALRGDYVALQSKRKANEVNVLKEKINTLTQELNTNPVSGIPNKRAFLEKVDLTSRTGGDNVIASIDIDSLKAINDNLGHAAGDKLLKTVAKVLSLYVDAFHVSGDELVAKGTSEKKLRDGLNQAQRALKSGAHSIEDENGSYATPSFSFGISKINDNDFTGGELQSYEGKDQVVSKALKRADLNMLVHKTSRELSGERAGRGVLPKGLVLKEKAKLTPTEVELKDSLEEEADSVSTIMALDEAGNLEDVAEAEALYKEAEKAVKTVSVEQKATLAELQSELEYQKDLKDSEDLAFDEDRYKELRDKIKQLSPRTVTRDFTIKRDKSTFKDTEEYLEADDSSTELLFDNNSDYSVYNLEDALLNEVDHSALSKVVTKLIGNIKKTELANENLKITYVEDFNFHDWEAEGIRTSNALFNARGLHNVSSSGQTRIFLNGEALRTKEAVVGTFAHEVIGHYGIAKVLGDEYRNFLIKLLNNNDGGKLKRDILSLLPRWRMYLDSWNSQYGDVLDSLDPSEYAEFPDTISKKLVKIPLPVATRLADEYMAELAKAKFMSRDFIETEVGLGYTGSVTRSSLRATRDRWMSMFIAKIKHLFKKVFGDSLDFISANDMERIVAESVDNLFEVIDTDHIVPTNSINSGIYKDSPISYDSQDTMGVEEISFAPSQLPTTQITNEFTVAPIEDVAVFVDSINSPLGSHTATVRSKLWNKLNNSIKENPLLSAMGTFGNMQHQEAYRAIESVFLGKITTLEGKTKAIASSINGMNPLQRQSAFYYFTTKGADIDSVPVTPLQKRTLVSAKDAIRELGRTLADAGIINKESYEENEDAYLHTMYLKYIDQYRGTGKKTSLMSWARSQKKLSERERLALGQIKDIKFLVPETLGILARDNVLLNMFNTINKASVENKLFWTLTTEDTVKYGKKRLTIDQAYEQIDRSKFILDSYEQNDINTFFTTDNPRKDPRKLYEKLKADTDNLKTALEALEQRILGEAHQHAVSTGQWSGGDAKAFLEDKYVKLDNIKHLGALRNKWVRKEIASDLNAFTSAYDLKGKDGLDKFLAPNGTLERINRFWKMSMVGLNPGSWVRNLMGNFALLDLSTSTNKAKLIGMLHSELSGTLKGNQSEYWKLAETYGLFGSTFSAVELQEIHNEYAEELTKAKASYEARTNSALEAQFHFLDERLLSIGKLLQNKTSKNYALLEGLFKTVSFRDYIETWEKQNSNTYANGIKDLSDSEKQIVYSKAALHANDSLFDYSQVNSFIKTLRRVPFGSPFITFSYKAIPASVRAMINHPIKFAQYATLPAMLTMVAQAMNDWDDDDIAKLRRALPDYYRNNNGTAFLPFKDSLGRPQILSLEYILPWSQLATASRKVFENYVQDGGESPASTTLKSMGTVVNEFGFLGGPAPTAIAAMLSGKDDFTGKDIVTPGASASQQLGDIMKFAYNLSVPSWISSNGWFSKMYQSFGKPETNAFGDVKYTPGQAIADITGFRATSVNEKSGIKSRRLGFETRLKEVATLRSKVLKDRNINFMEKAAELKDLTLRQKMIRAQMREALTGN